MTDIYEVYFGDEAAEELKRIPADRKALVEEKIRHIRRIGWQESLRLGLVRSLKGFDRLFEIKIKGRGAAFRLLCYQLGGMEGRIVVTTSCSAKGDLLGRKLKQEARRSETRIEQWIRLHPELLR